MSSQNTLIGRARFRIIRNEINLLKIYKQFVKNKKKMFCSLIFQFFVPFNYFTHKFNEIDERPGSLDDLIFRKLLQVLKRTQTYPRRIDDLILFLFSLSHDSSGVTNYKIFKLFFFFFSFCPL